MLVGKPWRGVVKPCVLWSSWIVLSFIQECLLRIDQCCVLSVTVKSLLFLILFLGVCLGFLAPYLINNPGSDLMLPSSSEQVLDDDLEAGDS